MSEPEDKIREYYEAQKLSAAQIRSIQAEGARQRDEALAEQSSSSLWRGVLIPAALCLTVLLAVWFFGQAYLGHSIQKQRIQVAEQVAGSHCRNNASAFIYTVEDFGQLQTRMSQLDFSLLPVEREIRDRFELSGARYCSVGGHVACHFHALDRFSGEDGSLYVAMLDPTLQRVSPGRCKYEEVTLEMWNDGTRFYCFAYGG